MVPAVIPTQGIQISPTIFKIAESSIWTLSIAEFPIPLQKECYIRLTIPPDLKHNHVALFGTGMFMGQTNTQISPEIQTDSRSNRIIQFRACYQEFSLGPSPQGRLEIMTIRTPIARRDTGPINFEVFQDMRYEKLISTVSAPGYVIAAKDLAPGKITIESVTPDESGV